MPSCCSSPAAFIAEVNNHSGIYASLSGAMANYHATLNSQQSTYSTAAQEDEQGYDRAHSSTGTSTSGTTGSWEAERGLSRDQLQAFCPETVMVSEKGVDASGSPYSEHMV